VVSTTPTLSQSATPSVRLPIPRLVSVISLNLRGDLVGQVVLLFVALVWARTPWMFVFWSVRWVVVAGIAIALRVALDGRDHTAVAVLFFGHLLGMAGSVLILPEFAPVIMVALFADMQLGTFAGRRLRRFLVGCVLAATVVALFSLQSWIGLVDASPRWVVVTAIAAHTLVTGALAVRFARETYTALRTRSVELNGMGNRLHAATDVERQQIERALQVGAIAELERLQSRLHDIANAVTARPHEAAAIADSAAEEAQKSLTALRTLSHGIFPDALRMYGLATALRGLAAQSAQVHLTDVASERFAPAVESALYAAVEEVVRSADSHSVISVSLQRQHDAVRLVVESVNNAASAAISPSQIVEDRIGAVGGTLSSASNDGAATMWVDVPLDYALAIGDDGDQRIDAAALARNDRRILPRFVSSNIVFCAAGMVFVAILWIGTRARAIGFVELILVFVMTCLLLARRALRRGRHHVAVVLICIETSVAGVLVTASLPDFAPLLALITALPIVLALPYLRERALDLIGVAQVVVLAVVAVMGLNRRGIVAASLLPRWTTISMVPLTTAAVAALIARSVMETRTELMDRAAALSGSLRQMVASADRERQRLERDLHDGAQQHFVATSMQLRALSRLAISDPARATALAALLIEQTGQARDELVALASGAFPFPLSGVGLADAIRNTAAVSTVPVEVVAEGLGNLPHQAATAVLYCCREAIQNTLKHGGSNATVRVNLAATPDQLSFEIADTGRGFDTAQTRSGLGLRSLTERMASVGGTLTVHSAPGRGTVVVGRVPVVRDSSVV
jgi:signal transduction histidine kinase